MNIEELSIIERASLMTGQSEWESREIKHVNLPAMVMSDGPNGVRRQTGSGDHLGLGESKPATCFPTAGTVANSWDPEEAQRVGAALGEEAKDLGVQVLLGPGINIKRNPLCGRNFEYYSEDPQLAGRMGAGFIRGIQSNNVGACPKHFAVNSQELRRQASNSVVDERTMREIYLTAFEIAVREAKPWTIMSSYNMINGVYAHENKHLLTDILRNEWGFDGTVISDWGGSNDIVASAKAGASLEMPAAGLASARILAAAVESGELDVADLNARAQEVVNIVEKTRNTKPSGNGYLTEQQIVDHHLVARSIAEKTSVLLVNDGTLPLAQNAKIAVIGDMAKTARYQGSGSSKVNATKVDNLLDELSAAEGITVTGYSQGYDRRGASNPGLITEAVSVANTADTVVVCMGLDERSESEGLDRSHLLIPQVQIDMLEELKKTGKKIVVVLVAGSAVETDWIEGVNAVLYISLSGQAGASAAARVLTGVVNPSGHLAETWPLHYADVPNAEIYPEAQRDSVYREGPFVGYRYYETAHVPVRFPFGYGLSYSTFEYSNLRIDDNGVNFTVTNTSAVAGDEVTQMYVNRPDSGVPRPARELKGFARIHLEAGESKDVRIEFDRYTFRHFDVASDTWQVEAGAWEIFIASNAHDTKLSATHVIRGTQDPQSKNEALGRYYAADVKNVSDEEVEALFGHKIEKYDSHGVFGDNDAISSWADSRSGVARFVANYLKKQNEKSLEKTGSPDLNMLFVMNMPPRAMAKMTGGMVSPEMVEGIVDIPNKHFWRGIGRVISGYFKNQSANKKTEQEIN